MSSERTPTEIANELLEMEYGDDWDYLSPAALPPEIDKIVYRIDHRDRIAAAIAADRETCAETCLRIWREAPNVRTDSVFTSYQQNMIGPGCSACAAAIRALPKDTPDEQ